MAQFALPIDVRPKKSFRPCESCGVKRVRYQARLDPPGNERVTHNLCESCVEAIRA